MALFQTNSLESSESLTLLEIIVNGKKNGRFHPKVEEFASHFVHLSLRGYEFLRDSIGKQHLPHTRSIRRWSSSNNGLPGLTKANIELLAENIKIFETQNIEPVFCLVFDEMNIKSGIRYVPSDDKIYGHVDFGNVKENNSDTGDAVDSEKKIAKNALFFLINGINVELRLPVGYILIERLTGGQKAEILKQVIVTLHNEGNGKIKVVTFDGDPAHFAMATHLGGSFKVDDSGKVNTSIKIEGIDWIIELLLDPNHIMKLCRNHLEAKQELFIDRPLTEIFRESELREILGDFYTKEIENQLKNDSKDQRKIQWKHLIELHMFQEAAQIRDDNKITKHHVSFRSKIMNVRLCAQTLHDKTGNSLLKYEFDGKLASFFGSIYLAIFFKIFHRFFSIFNSTRIDGEGWKASVAFDNVGQILDLLDSMELLIKSLRLKDETPVINAKCKTGFVGILVSVNVLRNLCKEYIESGIWESIPLYMLSQDLIEMFFGFLRIRLGCNDNPDAYTLSCLYKNVLGMKMMVINPKGNCTINSKYLSLAASKCSSKKENIAFDIDPKWKLVSTSNQKQRQAKQKPKTNFESELSLDDIETFTHRAIKSNAILVQKQLQFDLDCSQCLESIAQSDVLEICKKSEFVLNSHIKQSIDKFQKKKVAIECLSLMRSDLFGETCNHSHGIEDLLDNYRISIIKTVIDKYLNLRIKENMQRKTNNLHENFVRHANKKLTLFKGQ